MFSYNPKFHHMKWQVKYNWYTKNKRVQLIASYLFVLENNSMFRLFAIHNAIKRATRLFKMVAMLLLLLSKVSKSWFTSVPYSVVRGAAWSICRSPVIMLWSCVQTHEQVRLWTGSLSAFRPMHKRQKFYIHTLNLTQVAMRRRSDWFFWWWCFRWFNLFIYRGWRVYF